MGQAKRNREAGIKRIKPMVLKFYQGGPVRVWDTLGKVEFILEAAGRGTDPN
jgi:hypothetical protein